MAPGRQYEFGAYRLEEQGPMLFRDGERVALPPKVVELLVALVQAAGRMLTREQLLQHLWPDAVVEEGSLTSHISLLRKALAAGGNRPELIETVPKRGYRFVASVKRVGSDTPAGGDRRDMLVVLPFENLTSGDKYDYFSDGLTEEMITHLARLDPQKLGVIGRTTAMHYRDSKKRIDQIADELGVDYILEGSVRRDADRVRITSQLLRASDQTHLWAENYDRDLRDVLALQSDVAQSIAREIRLAMPAREQARLSGLRSVNPEAYEAYLKGRALWYERTTEALERSIEYFQQAIQKDENYAPAYAGLADAYGLLAIVPWDALAPREAMPKAKAMAQKALELDDTLADGHGALGTILLNYDWDWPAAYAELQKAVELNPNNLETHFRLASYFRTVGKVDLAAQELQLAQKLDPVSFRTHSTLGWLYLYAGRYDDAEAYLQEGVALGPDYPYDHFGLFKVYDHKKDYPQALAELQKFLAIQKLTGIAEGVDKMYRTHGYQRAKRYYFEQYLAQDLKKKAISYFIASDYAALDNKEKALDYLELAYRERSNYMNQLKVHSYFDNLRSEPRFQQLLKELNLQ